MRLALSHRMSREMDNGDLIGGETKGLAISDRAEGAIVAGPLDRRGEWMAVIESEHRNRRQRDGTCDCDREGNCD